MFCWIRGTGRWIKRKKPPRWQEGSHHFEVNLPADKTKSGKEETVRVGLKWELMAGKPMSDRDWFFWDRTTQDIGFAYKQLDLVIGAWTTERNSLYSMRALSRENMTASALQSLHPSQKVYVRIWVFHFLLGQLRGVDGGLHLEIEGWKTD